jgi:signal transduction histidine kinase
MPTQDSTRFLRTAAWIWIGFLVAMALMDFVLYTQVGLPLAQNPPLQQGLQGQPIPPIQPGPPPSPFRPVYLFYAASGLVALAFLALTHWDGAQKKLGRFFYPLLLLAISTAPILINVFITPRFPNGPLANAEGMALRQLPVLFVALALVAWEYELPHVIFFSVATTALELGLISIGPMMSQRIEVFFFIAIIRMISFIAVGVFISLLVARLRGQSKSLREANANLTHYASTLEQLTVSRERNRLARELHDTLAHSLTAISVSLETAKAYFDIDPNKTRELLDKSLDATRTGVDETRRALKALRSNALDDIGLRLAIQRAAESAASRSHLKLTVDLQDPMPSLSPDVEQTIYRVAQESIENIVKHSQAKSFNLRLENDGHLTTLTIEDDGIGFDPHGKESTGHFGLVGMRERAELAGGRLKVKSEKGKGTKVLLTI